MGNSLLTDKENLINRGFIQVYTFENNVEVLAKLSGYSDNIQYCFIFEGYKQGGFQTANSSWIDMLTAMNDKLKNKKE